MHSQPRHAGIGSESGPKLLLPLAKSGKLNCSKIGYAQESPLRWRWRWRRGGAAGHTLVLAVTSLSWPLLAQVIYRRNSPRVCVTCLTLCQYHHRARYSAGLPDLVPHWRPRLPGRAAITVLAKPPFIFHRHYHSHNASSSSLVLPSPRSSSFLHRHISIPPRIKRTPQPKSVNPIVFQ